MSIVPVATGEGQLEVSSVSLAACRSSVQMLGLPRDRGVGWRLFAFTAVRFLVAVVGFGALAFVIVDLRSAAAWVDHSDQVLSQSQSVERSVVDVETGVRGYLLTGESRFLQPARLGERILPAELTALRQLVRDDAAQTARAAALRAAIGGYLNGWVRPTIAAPPRTSRQIRRTTSDGKRRVDALRDAFAEFNSVEARLREDREADVHRVEILVAVVVVAVLLTLIGAIALATRWTSRKIARPLAQLDRLVHRFVAEDFSQRAPEDGIGEIGTLARSFNELANALVRSRAEAESLRRELERQARTDPLTGLANRRTFDLELARASADADRDRPLSLLSIDLNDFKSINDRYGHPAGDKALKLVARACTDSIRNSDLAARVGGDEFAILLPDTSRHGAHSVASNIEHRLHHAAHVAGTDRVTISIGSATSTGELDPEHLVRTADADMYAIKRDNARFRTQQPASDHPGNEIGKTTDR